MSTYNTITTSEELKGGYVRLVDQGDFKKHSQFKTLLWNIKLRDSFPIADVKPKLRDITKTTDDRFCRSIQPEGSTVAYVGNLHVVVCSETRREILLGEIIGFNPKKPLPDNVDFSIDIAGGIRDGVLTEIDYFTIEQDETGLWQKLQACNIKSIEDWCKENK